LPRSTEAFRLAMNMRRVAFFGIAAILPLSAQIVQIQGAPFSATQISERSKMLADGTRVTISIDKTVMYRDSMGRTRFEIYPNVSSDVPGLIVIEDPIALLRFNVTTQNRTVRTSTMEPPSPLLKEQPQLASIQDDRLFRGGPPPRQIVDGAVQGIGLAGDHFTSTVENFGTQLIEGILPAEGRRIITTLGGGGGGQ